MSVEADWTYSGDRSQLRTMNTNQAYDVATGIPYPTGGAAALVNANLKNRPYPGWGNTQQNRADGKANYHALQTLLTYKGSTTFTGSVSYTLSKAMNNVGENFFSSPIDPTDLSKDWGRSDDDQRHRLVVSGSAGVPADGGRGPLMRLARGFQFGGTVRRKRLAQHMAFRKKSRCGQTGQRRNARCVGAVRHARLERLPIIGVEPERQHGADDGLADSGAGAGDDKRFHAIALCSARASAAMSSSLGYSPIST